jgi:putative ABC transport system permease protein
MSIPLLDGRYFNIGDRSGSTPVVIVNESMAKRCWPGSGPSGKGFHVGGPQMKLAWATVVGVVADTKMGFARRT